MLTSPTAYLPPLKVFLAALHGNGWRWEAHENYQKGGWRNRCRIAGSNGPLLLTVPLMKGKNERQPIREVRISYRDDWQRQHVQAIRSAYGRAPYFEHYGPSLLAAIERGADFLWDYNLHLTQTLLAAIGNPLHLEFTKEFAGGDAGAGQVVGAVQPYPQVFQDRHGFLAGLSVIDGLFCLGPELLLQHIK